MADDPTPKRPEPASDAKKHANKLVVLSSVAKTPLNEEDSLLGEPDPAKAPPAQTAKPGDDGLIRPVGWTTRPGGTTTIIKLPPKTGVLPRLTSLSPKGRAQPPPLPAQPPPAKQPPVVGGEDETKKLPPTLIKVSAPVLPGTPPKDSIFDPPAAPPVEAKSASIRRDVPPPLPPRTNKSSAGPLMRKTGLLSKAPEPPATIPLPEAHHVAHVPPLVGHDASAPVAAEPLKPGTKLDKPAETAKADPMAQTSKLPAPIIHRPASEAATQGYLPLPVAPKEAELLAAEARDAESAARKHRLPPRASATGRLGHVAPPSTTPTASPVDKALSAAPSRKTASVPTPPKVFPVTPPATPLKPETPAAVTPQPVKASVTPPTIPLYPGKGMVKPPTIPLRPAPSYAPNSALVRGTGPVIVADEAEEGAAPTSRAEKRRKKRLIGMICFYVLLVLLVPGLYFLALYFSQETRVEGQVIPPQGMLLGNQAWIVTDFRSLATGIASDLADERMNVVQEMQEKLGHVQRAQADVATREARIRLLKDQIQADNDEEMSLVKQARDASQQIWDGPGAALEADYQSRLTALNQAIGDRAKANHLQYAPDPNFYSPEVWANAYRLALYEVPAGVDSVKERAWLDDQMKAWHDFTKAMDQKQNDLREQATQLKLAPASKVADLKSQIGDLQSRIDGTISEEEPLKAELEQAQTDLAAVQSKEAGLDGKPYQQLDALPESNIIKHLPLQPNGRFSWRALEKEITYGEGEKSHVFWIFARAYRSDGRQYWALNRIEVPKNKTAFVTIEPSNFVSTRAILRRDLSPDEQAQ